uniref:Uncharacterized protein n=1 Tax=Candidatus Kentrum sp. TC TaxID=2126339 RepID=A0A450YTK2_9GAMM|nr:MAG: hypothetical protein BECKTC1821E_GA0114239_10411 [Candidatus Kentron sp. TC]VFK50188.1 MAG: hypothetical protein BECKTC1821D_GA0114238_109315 [Candidatus Kentron sp. TC]
MTTVTLPAPLDATLALLAAELEICRAGCLYVALHTDPRLPERVSETLAREFSDTISFPLRMDARKAVFPVFFKYTYEHLGKGTNIFHVLDIEKLDEKVADEFIRALQGGREMFRNAPYALLFWMTPAFEKRLFRLAPGVSRRHRRLSLKRCSQSVTGRERLL